MIIAFCEGGKGGELMDPLTAAMAQACDDFWYRGFAWGASLGLAAGMIIGWVWLILAGGRSQD